MKKLWAFHFLWKVYFWLFFALFIFSNKLISFIHGQGFGGQGVSVTPIYTIFINNLLQNNVKILLRDSNFEALSWEGQCFKIVPPRAGGVRYGRFCISFWGGDLLPTGIKLFFGGFLFSSRDPVLLDGKQKNLFFFLNNSFISTRFLRRD